MNNPISFDSLIQVCLVVDDIEKTAKAWAKIFNVEVPKINVSPPTEDPQLTYRGKPAFYGIKMAVIIAGPFILEIIEPDENPSTFREFLDKHGNGVHHIGYEVGERRDAIVGELEALGLVMRTVGYYPGSSWTIVDSEDELGVNLNIKPVR